MITGMQLRASRGALRLSTAELALLSGVSIPTIQRFEQVEGVPPSRSRTLIVLQETLEQLGIEFIGSHEGAPGIRCHKTDADKAAMLAAARQAAASIHAETE